VRICTRVRTRHARRVYKIMSGALPYLYERRKFIVIALRARESEREARLQVDNLRGFALSVNRYISANLDYKGIVTWAGGAGSRSLRDSKSTPESLRGVNLPADWYAVVGDGGFAHAWQEMETAVRTGVHVTLILLNNGVLGFQKHAETLNFGKATNAVNFAPVNHAAIATACGCRGVRVQTAAELTQALAQVDANATTLIEVICDPNASPPITVFQSNEP